MNANDICLICHIEKDIYNLNLQTHTIDLDEARYYEKEAIRCFKSWRSKAGWLKDIPIYCLCCTKNTPSVKTLEEFKSLNITYIENYYEKSQVFSSGFITIPYTGYFFEKYNIPQNILIRIDLDNEILTPFPKDLIQKAYDCTIVGQYNEQYNVDKRKCFRAYPFDTSLIITNKKNKFYEEYFNLCFSKKILDSNEWLKIEQDEGMYWLEEFVVDYMYENNIKKIFPIQNYQCGLNYPSLEFFIKNKLTKNLYMSHNHIV